MINDNTIYNLINDNYINETIYKLNKYKLLNIC